jgi:ApeA N-terminal domain 1
LHLLFLTLTHVLEGLHRSSYAGVYMDPEAYKSVYQEIATKLPVSVAGDHRQSLKRRIEFGNEISFRKRLGELVASLPEDLRLLVTGQAKGVPDIWVTTRNEYTHWPDGSTSKAAEGAELYCVNTRLLMLVRVLLLRLVAVPAPLIVSALRGENRWARELAHVTHRERRQTSRRTNQSE